MRQLWIISPRIRAFSGASSTTRTCKSERLAAPVNIEERGGLSDGNMLWDAVPTLDGLGPWGDNDHCSERSADGSKVPEYVEVSSFAPKALLNAVAILDLLGSEAGTGS